MILDNQPFLALREKYKKKILERIEAEGYNPFIIEEEINRFCDEWTKEHDKYR